MPIICIGDDDLPQQSGQKDEKENYGFIEFNNERLNIENDKENMRNNDNLTCYQIELYPTISKNRLDLGSTSKEYTKEPKKKSLISVVTRKIACSKCKNSTSMHSLVKCMSCKKFFCVTCTEGQFYFDYICNFCFGDD